MIATKGKRGGKTPTIYAMPSCRVTAITLPLPDTHQVFPNSPHPLKTLASPPPWLPLEVKGAMCFQLCFQSPSPFWKRDEKMRLWHESVCSCRPQTQVYLQGLWWMCAFVGTCGFMCMCVKKCKEGNKSWMQRGTTRGLSWCEEAGSKLGCSKMPKWTISHKPLGLVLIDPGWTGVGGWAGFWWNIHRHEWPAAV